MFRRLTSFVQAQYAHFGFEEVITPTIYKKSLWEKSGHWENYAEDMFSVAGRGASGQKGGAQLGEDEEYGLKPMNCPGHCLIFASKQRSYRDLPIRFADFSPLHRNEISGALSGLTRVRRFHQDDGHIFCRPTQIAEEISKTLEFVRMVYTTLGLGPYRLTLSTRPKDQYIGTIEEWDHAEDSLKESLDDSGQAWTVNEGDGAFYGPKIDVILRDTDGKEHQTATIQLDFQLPKRFELTYQAPVGEGETDGTQETPVMIHRAILGSVERLMALLIEHYNGRYPFWLSPRQAIILSVNDDAAVLEYASKVKRGLENSEPSTFIRPSYGADGVTAIKAPDGLAWANSAARAAYAVAVDTDFTPRTLKKKISEAKRKHYSAIIVIGKQNVSTATVDVDLTGISDSYNYIATDRLVEAAIASKVDSGGKNGDQLRNLTMSPRDLGKVFDGMLSSHI